jgi:hypothetical protein
MLIVTIITAYRTNLNESVAFFLLQNKQNKYSRKSSSLFFSTLLLEIKKLF